MPTDSVVHQLAIRAGNKLRDEHLTLATAESCTGGMIAAAITDISGSSQWFERGFVTYSNQAKIEMIGVPPDLIDKHGAVSGRRARDGRRRAAQQPRAGRAVRHRHRGPAGGSEKKPVGTVSFGWSNRLHTDVETLVFKGDREQIRTQAAAHALRGLLKLLDEREG